MTTAARLKLQESLNNLNALIDQMDAEGVKLKVVKLPIKKRKTTDGQTTDSPN